MRFVKRVDRLGDYDKMLNMNEDLDKLAAEVYDYVCAHRQDNRNKNGSPGDPRKISNTFDTLMEPAKEHYRDMVRWHLSRVDNV
jgi:hypothetical protein